MQASTATGRCGPCCSIAPTGSSAITRPASSARSPRWSCPASSGAAERSSALSRPIACSWASLSAGMRIPQRLPASDPPCEKRPATSLGGPPMLRRITPGTIHPPLANYSHATRFRPTPVGCMCPASSGSRRTARCPPSFEAQAEACFENLLAILAAAGMGPADLVRLNTYLVDPADLAAYMAVRDRYVAAPPPASTLLVVHALARPQFKIEIEAVAAQITRRASPMRRTCAARDIFRRSGETGAIADDESRLIRTTIAASDLARSDAASVGSRPIGRSRLGRPFVERNCAVSLWWRPRSSGSRPRWGIVMRHIAFAVCLLPTPGRCGAGRGGRRPDR